MSARGWKQCADRSIVKAASRTGLAEWLAGNGNTQVQPPTERSTVWAVVTVMMTTTTRGKRHILRYFKMADASSSS